MPAGPRSMSAIVPVYNEEEQIVKIVPALRETLTARGGDWEIVIVDNASEDATLERLEPLLEPPRIRVLRNEINGGKGYSVRRGMLDAQGQLRLLCDADCTPSLPSLPAMEAVAEFYDIVAGARNDPDSEVARQQPIHRRAASLGFIFLCRRVMSEPLRDVFCGFKLFSGPGRHRRLHSCPGRRLGVRRRSAGARQGVGIQGHFVPNRMGQSAWLTAVDPAGRDPGAA